MIFRDKINLSGELPSVSFIVPCYNEAAIIESKIKNCSELDYPAEKLEIIFITDGPTDGSDALVSKHNNIKLMHQSMRRGKSTAENRSVKEAKREIIIFSDANTILQKNAVREIVKYYAYEKVGAVSGEKRILQDEKEMQPERVKVCIGNMNRY